jgi:hypothetical protein
LNKAEVAILETIASSRELSYREIQAVTNVSPRILIRYLAAFAKKRIVEEIGRAEWKRGKKLQYRITNKGRNALEQELVFKRTTDHPSVITETLVKNRIAMTLGQQKIYRNHTEIDTAFFNSPLGKVPVQMFFWTDFEKSTKAKSILEELKKKESLELLASHFIDDLKSAVLKSENKELTTGPFQMKDLINQEKNSLNADSMLLIHFNGKKIAKSTDWEKQLKTVETGDKLLRESWKKFREAIGIPGSDRQNWIIDETIERTRANEMAFKKYLAQSFDMYILDVIDLEKFADNPWNKLDSRSKAIDMLVEKFTWEICLKAKRDTKGNLLSFTKPSEAEISKTRVEIRKKIEEMLDPENGYIELVPTYLFKIKDKGKALEAQRKARESYPLPDGNISEGNR